MPAQPTTAAEATRPDWTHPLWCDQNEHSPTESCIPGLEHTTAVITWKVASDDVRVTISLNRFDEMFRGAQHIGTPKIVLSLVNVAACRPGGVPIAADVSLGPDDTRLLVRFLQEHLAELEHPVNSEDVPTEVGR